MVLVDPVLIRPELTEGALDRVHKWNSKAIQNVLARKDTWESKYVFLVLCGWRKISEDVLTFWEITFFFFRRKKKKRGVCRVGFILNLCWLGPRNVEGVCRVWVV